MPKAHATTSPPGSGPRIVVYFDDDCGFCIRCCRWASRADRAQRVLFIGARDTARHLHDLTGFDLDASMVAVDSVTGRKAVRARAVALILRALPAPYRWACWVGMPPFTLLSDRVYDRVARNRRRLSRVLRAQECAVPVPLPRRTAPPAPGPETQKPCA